MCRKETSLCFTGHRPNKLPQTEEGMAQLRKQLYTEVAKAVENGIDTFYFGACHGFDLLCSEAVLAQPERASLNLVAVVPFTEQAARWSQSVRQLYLDTLAQCDDVVTLSERYYRGCYHARNRYMVDNSCQMICYYDGGSGGTAYTVQYGTAHQLKITNLY